MRGLRYIRAARSSPCECIAVQTSRRPRLRYIRTARSSPCECIAARPSRRLRLRYIRTARCSPCECIAVRTPGSSKTHCISTSSFEQVRMYWAFPFFPLLAVRMYRSPSTSKFKNTLFFTPRVAQRSSKNPLKSGPPDFCNRPLLRECIHTRPSLRKRARGAPRRTPPSEVAAKWSL